MEEWVDQRGEPKTPLRVNVAMFGGPRAGKTSLLATMYRGVRGEVRSAGLGIRRQNPTTMVALDQATTALEAIPRIVDRDPTLMADESAVRPTGPGTVKRYAFTLHGAKVDVATLGFYDFAGEDIRAHEHDVFEMLGYTHIILVAINTPAMMEAYSNPDYEQLHLDWNLPDQLDSLLESWAGAPPYLVMFSPLKSERWLRTKDDQELLYQAVCEMYRQTFALLEREKFAETAVVLAPVETVGSVHYAGLDRYDATLPPTPANVVFTFGRERDGSAVWAPRYHEQPFRWALLAVTRDVDYATIADGAGGSWWQNLVAVVGAFYERNLPSIGFLTEILDGQAGVATFKGAAATLAEGRLLDRPFHVFREGALMHPVKQ